MTYLTLVWILTFHLNLLDHTVVSLTNRHLVSTTGSHWRSCTILHSSFTLSWQTFSVFASYDVWQTSSRLCWHWTSYLLRLLFKKMFEMIRRKQEHGWDETKLRRVQKHLIHLQILMVHIVDILPKDNDI